MSFISLGEKVEKQCRQLTLERTTTVINAGNSKNSQSDGKITLLFKAQKALI